MVETTVTENVAAETVLPTDGSQEIVYPKYLTFETPLTSDWGDWLPQLSKKDYAVISFVSEEYNNLVGLNVSPKPDSMVRVYMVGYNSDSFVDIPEQHIDSVDRSVSGTTVVEWGGSLLSN